jgi:hypothetical protein
MRIVSKYLIKSEGDLLFCKTDIKNFLKKHKPEYVESIIFAVMELGTNILKYPKEGEIWFLEEKNEYLIAALDKGEGISDVKWALQEGTSTSNTLGIGLYSLTKVIGFKLSLLSLPKKGTVAVFRPQNLKSSTLYLIRNYMDLKYGGDFVYQKGKFYVIGDVNGHGLQAQKTAEVIKEFFEKNALSCVIMEDILFKLHNFIKENSLRGVVLSVVEKSKFVNICGVGNMKIFFKSLNDVRIFSQKEGIIGAHFSEISKFTFELKNACVGIFSDGIEQELVREIFLESDDIFLNVIASVFFGNIKDDKSILVFKE